jgi:hypothetical protein
MAAIKRACQRDGIDPVQVSFDTISAESDVPPGWIRNCIVSRMMMYVVKDKHIDVWCEADVIVIGPGFGQPKLPL